MGDLTPEDIVRLKLLADALDKIDDLVFVRQKAGVEDLLFGLGATSQVREGENVTVNKINAGTIPFTDTKTVEEALTEIYLILVLNSLNVNSGGTQ